MLADPKFNTRPARCQNRVELDAIINDWSKNFTVDHHVKTFLEMKMVAGPVYNVKQASEDPQIAGARHMFPEVTMKGVGTFKIVGQPVKLSETPADIRLSPPALGEHNEEIYQLLGYSHEEICEMQEKGMI